MKHILLTGGSGFVGRNIIEYFKRNHPGDFVIDAPRSSELNVLDEEQVVSWLSGGMGSLKKGERYDIVLHFAVYTDAVDKSKDGSKMYEYNMKSFMNFFNHRDMYGKMFYAGSGAEYDKSRAIESVTEDDLYSRFTETDCPGPSDPYGKMKYEIGRLIDSSDNVYNLRIFGLFGKYEYSFRLITYLCHRSIEGKPFELNRNVVFDYLYIDDFCEMVYKILSKDTPSYHTYNMVSGSKVDLLTLCDIVNDIASKKGHMRQAVTVESEGLNLEYTASNDRFMAEFPDIKIMDIRDSVGKLYSCYEAVLSTENK